MNSFGKRPVVTLAFFVPVLSNPATVPSWWRVDSPTKPGHLLLLERSPIHNVLTAGSLVRVPADNLLANYRPAVGILILFASVQQERFPTQLISVQQERFPTQRYSVQQERFPT
ncbi:hypothetical protein OAL35_01765 [bacterium]|nr:hypothetical protein [bacterium]